MACRLPCQRLRVIRGIHFIFCEVWPTIEGEACGSINSWEFQYEGAAFAGVPGLGMPPYSHRTCLWTR